MGATTSRHKWFSYVPSPSNIPLGIILRNIVITHIFPVNNKDKHLVSNYHPISLLPICSKIFQKNIFNNIYRCLVTNSLILKHQSGFCPGDSKTNQLLYLVHMIQSALDEQKEVHNIFLDMSKAFDKSWHDGLLFKLQWNGIEGQLLQLFKSYLSNRKQWF